MPLTLAKSLLKAFDFSARTFSSRIFNACILAWCARIGLGGGRRLTFFFILYTIVLQVKTTEHGAEPLKIGNVPPER